MAKWYTYVLIHSYMYLAITYKILFFEKGWSSHEITDLIFATFSAETGLRQELFCTVLTFSAATLSGFISLSPSHSKISKRP
jgi:hypothetical protein